MTPEIRPTTPEDWQRLVAKPPLWRIWAQTALIEDIPVAIGGIAYLPDGTVYAFIEGHDALRRFPVTMHRIVKRGLAAVRARGIRTLVARPDAGVPAAGRWLRRLGFEPIDVGTERVFAWH